MRMPSLPIIYRGWWVLAGLFFVYAASNGILMHTLPLTYPALIDEFGWSAEQVTTPATVMYVVAALCSPPVGIFLDRYSPRLIIFSGAILMVICLFAFSRISELWHMVVVFAVFAIALSACGIVSTMLVLTRWFKRLRGRATGILLLASSLGASVFPLILGAGMNSFGWRGALVVFAAIAALLAIVPALALIRDRPETPIASDGAAQVSGIESGPTFREAVRQPRFYLIALATGSIWLTVISLLQHQAIYFDKDLGISRANLPTVFSTFFAFSVFGKLSFGLLSDRLDKGLTLIVSIGILALSLVILRSISGNEMWIVYSYAAIAGIGFSGSFTTIQIWIASFFAGQSYGKILASLTLFDTLAGALGTRLAGTLRTQTGSYIPVIDILIVICGVAALSIFIVKSRYPASPKTTVETI